jgi:hypothetical protein
MKTAGMQRLKPRGDLRACEALELKPMRVEPAIELAQRIDVAVTVLTATRIRREMTVDRWAQAVPAAG